jgi:hypothetical protein
MDSANESTGIPFTSEEVGFKHDEMIACPNCGRSNPPNRLNCLYCAAQFEAGVVDSSRVKLALRRLELWENGFNVVAISSSNEIAGNLVVEVVRNTGISSDLVEAAADGISPLPVARVETEEEAKIVAANLSRIGVGTTILRDSAIAVGKMPVRCRSVEFGDEVLKLTPFNSGPDVELKHDEIVLIVAGKLFESKSHATETRKSRKSTTEIHSESTAETAVIDIYHSDSEHAGFRIPSTGFDFSCLGQDKNFLAARNMNSLLERIVRVAPSAKFVSDYNERRRLLDEVWEVDERTDSLGFKRSGLGKTQIGNVTTRSNLSQFTKYSRVHRQLL